MYSSLKFKEYRYRDLMEVEHFGDQFSSAGISYLCRIYFHISTISVMLTQFVCVFFSGLKLVKISLQFN